MQRINTKRCLYKHNCPLYPTFKAFARTVICDLVVDRENVIKWDIELLNKPICVALTTAEEPELRKIAWQPCPHHCLTHNYCQKLDIFTVVVWVYASVGVCLFLMMVCLGVQYWDRRGGLCLDFGSSLFWQQALTTRNWFLLPCLSQLLQKKQF